MATVERFGRRPVEYSYWHRPESLRRFIPVTEADRLGMCDIDGTIGTWIEYSIESKEPLALIETARDVGQRWKNATALARPCSRARLPGYIVLFSVGDRLSPADPMRQARDCVSFRIKRVFPKPEDRWRVLPAADWAMAIVRIRAWSIKRLGQSSANDERF